MNPSAFDHIKFIQTGHSYKAYGVKLTSVTTKINSLKPEIDWDQKAADIARREGVPAYGIKKTWNKSRQEGLERGTWVHEYIRADLLQLDYTPQPLTSEMLAYDSLRQTVELGEVVACEWVVGDVGLGVAGTLDALFYTAGAYHLWDWKTGKEFRLKDLYKGPRLKAPFDDLDDCEIERYSLQVSLYRLLVERHAGVEIATAKIVHFPRDGGYSIYDAKDYRERLLGWLEKNRA